MPSLFGEMFMATGEPNRYDIPAFFSLHLWLYQDNPAGLFTPFNPTVSCRGRDGRDRPRGRPGRSQRSRDRRDRIRVLDRPCRQQVHQPSGLTPSMAPT